MSALPNQSYANLGRAYWLTANGTTPTGQSVTELSVIGTGSTIEERLLTTSSNAQIQINTLIGNTRTFKMGLFAVPDLVNPVPVNNSFSIDIGNALPALTVNQTQIICRQPIVLDTAFNISNFQISQSSTSTILSNGSSVIALSNAGKIELSPSTLISNGGSINTTNSSNITISNVSGSGFLELSGSELVIGNASNDALHFVSRSNFTGTIVYNEFGWNPDPAQYVYLTGLTDPNVCNLPAWRILLSNTSNNASFIPFGMTYDYVFAQNTLRIFNSSNSNVSNVFGFNGISMTNNTINRWNNYFMDCNTGVTYFQTGTPSPSNLINAIVISNNGLVGFPVGIDVTSFSNAPSSSNSIGGVTLSSGSVIASPTGSNSLAQFTIFSNLFFGQGGVPIVINSNLTVSTTGMSNSSNTCNVIGGVQILANSIVGSGNSNTAAGTKGFYIQQGLLNTIVYWMPFYNISGFRAITVPLYGSVNYQNRSPAYGWVSDGRYGFMMPPYTTISYYDCNFPGTVTTYINSTAEVTYQSDGIFDLLDPKWYYKVGPIAAF